MGTPSHKDLIICPECSTTQEAIVLHTVPFYSYVHTCVKCGYVIMESEWKQNDEPPMEYFEAYGK
jgi:uncharacterized Zn finger protein